MSVELSGLRALLHAPGPVFFAQTMFPDPGVSAILGGCQFDFVMLDAEHGPFTLESLRGCIEALKSTATAAAVRTASYSEAEIKQVLDLGADGVIAPRVESAEEARALVRAARYAPEGIRGVSRAVRATRYGLDESYVEQANGRIAVIAIIESGQGVKQVGEIVQVPGLDGIMVGADDLSADLNLYGQYDHPRIIDAIETVTAAALSAGLKVGGRVLNRLQRQNMLVHCGNDAVVLRGAFEQALANQRAASAKF